MVETGLGLSTLGDKCPSDVTGSPSRLIPGPSSKVKFPNAQHSPWPLTYLFHEELDSLAGHTVLAAGRLPLLDDVPSLARGVIFLLAQIL